MRTYRTNDTPPTDAPSDPITEQDLTLLGLNDPRFAPLALRVGNGLLRNSRADRSEILATLCRIVSRKGQGLKGLNYYRSLVDKVLELEAEGPLALSPQGQALADAAEAREQAQKEEAEAQAQVFARTLLNAPNAGPKAYQLRSRPLPFDQYAPDGGLEEGALEQMRNAMQLPISMAGALMPDAHKGYGLPIGGVLATDPNIVIPYAVGVDIACRMCLSVWDMPETALETRHTELVSLLKRNTEFGVGGVLQSKVDTSVIDRVEWQATKLLRELKDRAWQQLGTSGSGNHFVEWGIVHIDEASEDLGGLPPGRYLALLSHSGSRGTGAMIAGTYSKLAQTMTQLPGEAQHLAWLDLSTQEGQEYWLSMNLAGDYASANHNEIHRKMALSLQMEPVVRIENHHNFAWKEILPDGREAIVHRKGATPAGTGVLGIIPGSMTQPGFVVRGLGQPRSLNSASHGAGRLMSRTAARKDLSQAAFDTAVETAGVTLLGADIDEAPMVYKDIHAVMNAQQELVQVLARFEPRIVRMAAKGEKAED